MPKYSQRVMLAWLLSLNLVMLTSVTRWQWLMMVPCTRSAFQQNVPLVFLSMFYFDGHQSESGAAALCDTLFSLGSKSSLCVFVFCAWMTVMDTSHQNKCSVFSLFPFVLLPLPRRLCSIRVCLFVYLFFFSCVSRITQNLLNLFALGLVEGWVMGQGRTHYILGQSQII